MAQLNVRIDEELKKEFAVKCIEEGLSAQDAIEAFIRGWIKGNQKFPQNEPLVDDKLMEKIKLKATDKGMNISEALTGVLTLWVENKLVPNTPLVSTELPKKEEDEVTVEREWTGRTRVNTKGSMIEESKSSGSLMDWVVGADDPKSKQLESEVAVERAGELATKLKSEYKSALDILNDLPDSE